MSEISLCVMTRELCSQFFREYENDPAMYSDESRLQPYVYSDEAAEDFYNRKQVLGRLELVAVMDGRTIGHVQLKNINAKKGNASWASTCRMTPSRDWGTVRGLPLCLPWVISTLNAPKEH